MDEEQSASQNESGTGGMENYVAECAAELPFGARWLIVKSLGLVGWHGITSRRGRIRSLPMKQEVALACFAGCFPRAGQPFRIYM